MGELQVKKIGMSEHAYQRASERFNLSDKKQALEYFRNWLRFSKKVGSVTSEDGTDSVLYAHGRIGIHLTLDLTTIKTVCKYEQVTYTPLKNKIELLHRKEYNKVERLECSKCRHLADIKLKYAIEYAQLNYREKRTRSENVRQYCKTRKEEIDNLIAKHEEELELIRSQKRQIARSMVAVL